MVAERFRSLEAFYEYAAGLFEPDGPGRVLLTLGDAELAELENIVGLAVAPDRIAADGAAYVIPTPAGVVAIRRVPEPLRVEQIWRSRSCRTQERVIVNVARGEVITRDLDRPLCNQGFGHQLADGFQAQHYLIYDPWTGFDAEAR